MLDEAWSVKGAGVGVLVRYCDDFVILCSSRSRAEEAQRRVEGILLTLGLRLHVGKTRIVHLTHGEEGFDFLGFHHRKVESWKQQGCYYLQKWPSDRNMAMIRSKIRDATGRHCVGKSVDAVVEELNPVLRGWGNYFRRVTPFESSA